MYKEKISRYIDAHRKEMLEDIGALCRINSVKGSYRIGKPYAVSLCPAFAAGTRLNPLPPCV